MALRSYIEQLDEMPEIKEAALVYSVLLVNPKNLLDVEQLKTRLRRLHAALGELKEDDPVQVKINVIPRNEIDDRLSAGVQKKYETKINLSQPAPVSAPSGAEIQAVAKADQSAS